MDDAIDDREPTADAGGVAARPEQAAADPEPVAERKSEPAPAQESTPELRARKGMVQVELSGHLNAGEIDGDHHLPGETVWVHPDKAASLRWSGYAAPEPPAETTPG